MSYRQFIDAAGKEWSVYDVNPALDDRRGGERRQSDDVATGGERRQSDDVATGGERRVEERRVVFRSSRPVRLRQGWLCFETDGERRRLQPIPENWAQLPDKGLVALLEEARVAPRRMNVDETGASESGAGISPR